MHKIKLIVSDIDGTVIGRDFQVEESLPAVVKELDQPFVLASGRSPYGIHPVAETLGTGDYPIVAYNGALVLEHGRDKSAEILYSYEVEKNEAVQVAEFLQENFPNIAVSMYSDFDWYVDKLDKWIEIERQLTGDEPVIVDIVETAKEKLVHKFMLIGEVDEIKEAEAGINALNLKETICFLSQDNYLEVINKSTSKGRALEALVEHFDLDFSEVFAIGDHINDLPMLELAGISVAMGNANDQVKETAKYITAKNVDGGVAQAIREHILGK